MKCAYCNQKLKSGKRVKDGKQTFCSTRCRDAYRETYRKDNVAFKQDTSSVEAAIDAPEFKGQDLTVRFSFWKGPQLYLDGELQKADKKKLFSYTRLYKVKNVEQEDIGVRISSKILDPNPVVAINERFYPIEYDLRWYEYLWLGFPLLLFLVGGLIGIVLGSVTMLVNSRYFQSRRKVVEKYSLTGLIMVVCFLSYYQTAKVINNSFNQNFLSELNLVRKKLHGQDPVVYLLTKHPWVVTNVVNEKGKVMQDRLDEYKGDIKYFHSNGDFVQLHRDGSKMTGTWHYVAKGHKILLDAGREIMVLFITRISDNQLYLKASGITVEHRKKK